MSKERERLTGHPSDYGGRTLENEEHPRTADGEPLTDRGSADAADDAKDTGAQEDEDDQE